MKKKIIIIAVIALFMAGVSAVFAFNTTMNNTKDIVPSQYPVGITYQEAVKSDKPMIAIFYVDWCTYCKRFMPKLKLINMIYGEKYNIVKINFDQPENRRMAKDYGIESFPTIYIIDEKYDNRAHIPSAYYGDLGKLRKEFDRYLRIHALLEKAKG